MQMALRQNTITITETCFLSKNMKYLIYWDQKFLPKQWSTALIFLQIYKVRSESFMKIGLSVFEKTCQEKKDDNRGKET